MSTQNTCVKGLNTFISYDNYGALRMLIQTKTRERNMKKTF